MSHPESTNEHRNAADDRGRILTEAEYRTMSRRSLLTGGGAAVAALLGWRTLQNRPVDDRIPDVLRRGHEFNEALWRGLYRESALAPTFDYSESSQLRVNGRWGLRDEIDIDTFEITVIGRDGETIGTHNVADFRALPQTEMTVEHKCIEGWSHVVTWGGVVFSDWVRRFYPEQADAKYVALSTPRPRNRDDRIYEVGVDMASMMHPQTMLTLDLQREPLTPEHGAPVRLTTPVKYGIKQIKRIGVIAFSDTRPENDYWAERGYDWYAGL